MVDTIRNLFWDRQEHRLRALWRLLITFAIFLILTTVLGALAGLVLVFWLVSRPGADVSLSDPAALSQAISTDPSILVIGGVTSLLATLLALLIAARLLDRRRAADFGLHFGRAWWVDFGFGLLLGALLMAAIFLAERALGWVRVTGVMHTARPETPFALAILPPVILFFCVGIYEELLARGYLLRNLAEGLRWRSISPRGAVALAWVLSSVAFGFLHANNPNATVVSTVALMVAGLFLGLGYVLTGELAIPIGLHMTWNFFQGNVFGFPVSGGSYQTATFIAIEQTGPTVWTGGAFGPEAGLLGIAAILLGSLLIVLWVRWRRGGAALQGELAEYRA